MGLRCLSLGGLTIGTLPWLLLGLLVCSSLTWATPVSPEMAKPEKVGIEPDLAMQAYRAGDYSQAITRWQDELTDLGAAGPISERRGHLCYNIGNALYRADKPMHAVAWFQAGLRHLPRNGDLRANLNFVRGEMGLGPAKGDGLTATLGDLISRWTPGESKGMALWSLAGFAILLFMEAMYGGSLWRGLALISSGAVLVFWLPLVRHGIFPDQPASMVIAERKTPGRSEPRPDARPLDHLDPSQLVYPEDTWQDWVKVRTSQGKEVWLDQDKVVSIWR